MITEHMDLPEGEVVLRCFSPERWDVAEATERGLYVLLSTSSQQEACNVYNELNLRKHIVRRLES